MPLRPARATRPAGDGEPSVQEGVPARQELGRVLSPGLLFPTRQGVTCGRAQDSKVVLNNEDKALPVTSSQSVAAPPLRKSPKYSRTQRVTHTMAQGRLG